MKFTLQSPFSPKGGQPEAIKTLVKNIKSGIPAQTLLGVTGSGKTFTMANVIEQLNCPTLILSHNKTLAAQLYAAFKEFFPTNAIEYFVSYYDYYQPESYNPVTGVYIEKDLAINEEIEKMRLNTMFSLLSGRRDVVVISSVSCIYGLSNPENFREYVRNITVGDKMFRDDFLLLLSDFFYSRSEINFTRSTFRVRGDIVDLYLAYQDKVYRFIFLEDKIETIQEIDPKTGRRIGKHNEVTIFPANNFMVNKSQLERAIDIIEKELHAQINFFLKQGCEEEAKRLKERTHLDIDMMRELGYCPGIENYSRCFDNRKPGERPYCLLDYFPEDFLMIIDESHVSIPQIAAMAGGDRSRKNNLIDHGFRIPAARDNRPLSLTEFESLLRQVIYVSATPADYEIKKSASVIVEQLVRPTGLLDPAIEVHPTPHQIDHLQEAIRKCIAHKERVLITTLTKRMAEELTKYLESMCVRCRYIHAEVKTLDRITILEELRLGVYDVLVGVNLLREGLDLPEVSLVAILDADKEGFLRNFRSLIQTIGRAARHVNGKVIMYADKITPSMEKAIQETERRRSRQIRYNEIHGIVPQPVVKAKNYLAKTASNNEVYQIPDYIEDLAEEPAPIYLSIVSIKKAIRQKKRAMEKAADMMDYIKAQAIQKEIQHLEHTLQQREKKS